MLASIIIFSFLSQTVEAAGRIGIDGVEVRPFDHDGFRRRLQALKVKKAEAITVSFINSFANSAHEVRLPLFSRLKHVE
jgi:N-methylhydantoinase A/oxoprolinase/acetone carboxylase beta subunit